MPISPPARDKTLTVDPSRLPHACELMLVSLGDSRVPIEYEPLLRAYRLPLSDETEISQRIWFCPFCGAELPPDLRDAYGDALEALGLEFFDDPPEPYRSDAWWWPDGPAQPG